MSNQQHHLKPWSRAVVKLLREGTVYSDAAVWEELLYYQEEIQQYISVMGLELMLRKDEGLAFVTQFEDEEGNTLGLVSRRQIGFEASIVLVVLRQLLEEFDHNPTQVQATEKFIRHSGIREEVELFLPEKYNRVKLLQELDNCIKKLLTLGYLKQIKSEADPLYQVQRVIKDKVTLDILKDFKLKLEEYV